MSNVRSMASRFCKYLETKLKLPNVDRFPYNLLFCFTYCDQGLDVISVPSPLPRSASLTIDDAFPAPAAVDLVCQCGSPTMVLVMFAIRGVVVDAVVSLPLFLWILLVLSPTTTSDQYTSYSNEIGEIIKQILYNTNLINLVTFNSKHHKYILVLYGWVSQTNCQTAECMSQTNPFHHYMFNGLYGKVE